MKKFFAFAILLLGLSYILFPILNDSNLLYIDYPSLAVMDKTVANGFSFTTMKKNQAFPEKVIDMLITVDPSLQKSITEIKKELKKEPKEIGLMLTNNNPIIALRRVNKIVTRNEYIELLKKLVKKQGEVKTNIRDEGDLYPVYLKVDNECSKLLTVLPEEQSLLELHANLCSIIDDIEQIKAYNKQRDKREDKESEKFVQGQVEYFIGRTYMELLQKIFEIGEVAKQNNWI